MNTVTKCVKAKEWNKDGKVVPIYSVTLTDGTVGESFGKEIPEGTPEDQIEITEGQYGKKFKLKANGFKGGFKAQRAANESYSLSYAKDVAVAHIGQGKAFTAQQIIQVAEEFYKWLESKKS